MTIQTKYSNWIEKNWKFKQDSQIELKKNWKFKQDIQIDELNKLKIQTKKSNWIKKFEF